jgi:hypothetical protein
MQIKLVNQYKNKLTFLFLLIGTCVVLTPLMTGWMLYKITCDTRQIYIYVPDEAMAIGIHSSVRRYAEHIETVQKSLDNLQEVVYESQNLQSSLAEEFLESGLAIDNFTVRTVPPANKTRTVPSKGSEDWKYFNFATVSLNGLLEANKISQLMFFLATRPKLWHMSVFEMQPMDSPADFVTRFQRTEMDITTQGRVFERDSLLELIAKRANKNKLSVSMTFFVPIVVEG